MERVTHTCAVAGSHFLLEVGTGLWNSMSNLHPFQSREWSLDATEALFHLQQVPSLPEPGDALLYISQDGSGNPEIALFSCPDYYFFRMRPLPGCPVAGLLQCSKDFKQAQLCLTGTADTFALNNALMLLFAFTTAHLDLLEMHASVVVKDGRGYLFLGPSGTGKSTHSRLWLEQFPDAELLNDDNPILRVMPDGTARVYGSPWSGKTPCYKAADVPAGACVWLRQAPENRIQRLSPVDAYVALLQSASGFRPFTQLADGWHRTMEKLCSGVAFYTLDCLPDAAAAALCYQTVKC